MHVGKSDDGDVAYNVGYDVGSNNGYNKGEGEDDVLTSRPTTTFAEDLPQRDRPHD